MLAGWKLLSQLLPVLPKSCLLVCSLECYKPTKEQLQDKMLKLAISQLLYLGKEKEEDFLLAAFLT